MAPPAKRRVQSSMKKKNSAEKERSPSTGIVTTESGHSSEEQPSSSSGKRKATSSSSPTESPTKDLFDHRFVEQDCFFLKANKLKLEVVSSIAHTFAEPETDADGFLIPAEDTSKFRLMRSDYTPVPILFRCASRPSLEWKNWVVSELEDLGFKDHLRRAGVLSAIISSTQLGVNRDIRGLRHVVRRWNKTTHTFICAWGEFTPTLDDVMKLLRLPVMGDASPFSIELSAREEEIRVLLIKGLSLCRHLENNKLSSRSSFACWIRFFWGTMEKEKFQPGAGYGKGCRVEAMVALWLSKFVFPDLQGDVVLRQMFPLAIRIVQGVRFPLGAVFLGTFYKHLDLIFEDEVLGAGKYAIDSVLAINFLQVFLWERIRKYAGEPASSTSVVFELGVNTEVPLWSRWFHMKHTKERPSIWFFVDEIDSFTFRPYVGLEREFSSRTLVKEPSAASEIVKIPMCDSDGTWADLEYVVSIRPGLLPAWIGTEVFSVNYWPHRVLRQFGLDQGVPRLYSFAEEDVLKSPSFGVSRFINSSLKSLPTIKSLTIQIAGDDREGLYTPKFATYWKKMIAEFNEFIKGPKSATEPPSPNSVPKRMRLDTREVRSFCTKIGMPFTVIDGEEKEVVGAVKNGRNSASPEEDLPLAEMISRDSPTEEWDEPSSEMSFPASVPRRRKSNSRRKSATPKRKSARLSMKGHTSDELVINGDVGNADMSTAEMAAPPPPLPPPPPPHPEPQIVEGTSNLTLAAPQGHDDVAPIQIVENGKNSLVPNDDNGVVILKLKSEVDTDNVEPETVTPATKSLPRKRKSLPLALVSGSNNYPPAQTPLPPPQRVSPPPAKRPREEPAQEPELVQAPEPEREQRQEANTPTQNSHVTDAVTAVSSATKVTEPATEESWQSKLNKLTEAFNGNTAAPSSVEEFLKLSGRTKLLAGISIPEESFRPMSEAIEKHGDFAAKCWASKPVRDMMFSRLSLVFYALEQIPLGQLSENALLALRDVVREAGAVGFAVEFLLEHLRKLVSAIFGKRIFFDKLTALDSQTVEAQRAFDAAKAKLDGLKKIRSEVVARASVSTGTEGDCIRHALDFCTSLVHGI